MLARPIHAALAAICGIGLMAGAITDAAKAQKGPIVPTVEVGGSEIKLPVKAGDCALERSHPVDRRALELVENLIRQSNQLHLSATGCADLAEWRAGRLANLKTYTQVQSPLALHRQSFSGQEKAAISASCNAIRRQGGALVSSVTQDIRQRLQEARQQALIQNMSLLGALDEDEFGCYTGLVIKGQTEQGQPKTQLCIFATTVLNGKLVYLYQYSDRLDESEIERVLSERKAIAKAYVEANGGHKK